MEHIRVFITICIDILYIGIYKANTEISAYVVEINYIRSEFTKLQASRVLYKNMVFAYLSETKSCPL